jgi:hypothetical protein
MQKIQLLPITFHGDVLFELSLIHLNVQNLSQMQGINKKYDGHAWCKLVTSNIKKLFGLSFHLGLGRFITWVTCGACKMIVKTLRVLPLAMKHSNAVNVFTF